MNKALKLLGSIVGVSIFVILGIYLYVFREQSIDTDFIPREFTYCGKQIYGNHKRYREIVDWLETNNDGWVLSYVTYMPNHRYYHEAFWVDVHKGAVIVSYKTDSSFPQFVKQGKHSLSTVCEKNS